MKIVRVGKTGTIGDSGGEDGLEIIWVLPFLRGRPGVCDVDDDTGLIALLVIYQTLRYGRIIIWLQIPSIYEESTYATTPF